MKKWIVVNGNFAGSNNQVGKNSQFDTREEAEAWALSCAQGAPMVPYYVYQMIARAGVPSLTPTLTAVE